MILCIYYIHIFYISAYTFVFNEKIINEATLTIANLIMLGILNDLAHNYTPHAMHTPYKHTLTHEDICMHGRKRAK